MLYVGFKHIGVGTLIFSYIRRLVHFFIIFFLGRGGVKIMNFNITLGFQQNENFWGQEEIVDILGVITQLG